MRNLGFGWGSEKRFALCAKAHLSNDETVAKMGHPDLDVGHPSSPVEIETVITMNFQAP